MEEKTKAIIVALILLVVVLGGIRFLMKNTDIIPKSENIDWTYDTKITVEVRSKHIVFDADYTLYVDGKAVESWRMGSGDSKTIETNYKIKKSEGIKDIKIEVISTGGGFGTESDSRNISVGGANKIYPKITLYA